MHQYQYQCDAHFLPVFSSLGRYFVVVVVLILCWFVFVVVFVFVLLVLLVFIQTTGKARSSTMRLSVPPRRRMHWHWTGRCGVPGKGGLQTHAMSRSDANKLLTFTF